MKFKELEFYNFRNIKCSSIEVDALDIIFLGINGQGKTNLLEAIYMLCYGSSFRTQNLKDVICHGQKEMRLSATFSSDYYECSKVEFVFQNNAKKIYLDGKLLKDRKELIYNFPCIVYSHEDINFIKGEPENRRNFFDQMISLYSPEYLDNLRLYNRVLKQRNAAIKAGEFSLIQFYDLKLVQLSLVLMNERKEIITEFNELYPTLYKKISGTETEISIKYRTSFKSHTVDEMLEELKACFERDIKMQTTTLGIHRDRFTIYDEHGPFINTGSTGQLRLATLLLRVAEGHFFLAKTGRKPILLIDDVLLELDSTKRARFLNEMKNYEQAFYTFLPQENYFDASIENELVYNIVNGDIKNGSN